MTIGEKGGPLAKTSAGVRQLATKLEKARQVRNERVARADSEYVEAVRRALAGVEGGEGSEEPAAPPIDAQPQA
jgi:hypothetical protein